LHKLKEVPQEKHPSIPATVLTPIVAEADVLAAPLVIATYPDLQVIDYIIEVPSIVTALILSWLIGAIVPV